MLNPWWHVSVGHQEWACKHASILRHISPFLFSLFLSLRVSPTSGIHNMQFLCTNWSNYKKSVFACVCVCVCHSLSFYIIHPDTQCKKVGFFVFVFFHSPSLSVLLLLTPSLLCFLSTAEWKKNEDSAACLILLHSPCYNFRWLAEGGRTSATINLLLNNANLDAETAAIEPSLSPPLFSSLSRFFSAFVFLCFAYSLCLTPYFFSPLGTIFTKIYSMLDTHLLFS